MPSKALTLLIVIAVSICSCDYFYSFYTITNMSDNTIDVGYSYNYQDTIGRYLNPVTPGQSYTEVGSRPLEEAFPSGTLGIFIYDDKKLKAPYDSSVISYSSHIKQAELRKIVISIDSLKKVHLKLWYP